VSPFSASTKFGAGVFLGDGYVTSDAGAYYFATQIDDAGLVNGIFVGQQGGKWPNLLMFGGEDGQVNLAGFTPAFTPSADASGLVDDPIVTTDELTLYMSVPDGTGTPHIQTATRASTGAPFGAPSPVHELDSAGGEYASWISPDACRIYLTRMVAGQWDLFVAQRSQ
jgi:hypothetical protein